MNNIVDLCIFLLHPFEDDNENTEEGNEKIGKVVIGINSLPCLHYNGDKGIGCIIVRSVIAEVDVTNKGIEVRVNWTEDSIIAAEVDLITGVLLVHGRVIGNAVRSNEKIFVDSSNDWTAEANTVFKDGKIREGVVIKVEDGIRNIDVVVLHVTIQGKKVEKVITWIDKDVIDDGQITIRMSFVNI